MPKVTPPKLSNPISDDGKTLTCQRCGKSWARKYSDRLPKACSKCGSRYWQKPLTPYWASFRKEQAAAKEAAEIKLITTQQEHLQKILAKIHQPDTVKVYYCPNPADLEIIKDRCTFWLPENSPDPKPLAKELYQVGHTVATASQISFNTIRGMIKDELLPYDKVFFIKIEDPSQYIYSFNPDGTVRKFWGYKWPDGIEPAPATGRPE